MRLFLFSLILVTFAACGSTEGRKAEGSSSSTTITGIGMPGGISAVPTR